MSCNCFGTLQEAQLVRDCYPPSKALLSAGPDFKPLSSDLSKLTYRCTNQSSRLAKVGDELEKRVMKEAGRSSGGYAKSRASLLISLAILRTLIVECHRDLHLFSPFIIRIINISLGVKVYQKGGPDLEVIGRAASCFTAFTSYVDGARGLDLEDSTLRTYLLILAKFAQLATETVPATTTGANGAGVSNPDLELQNRTRLIGLAALNGVASSPVLLSANSMDSSRQIEIIVPALCTILFQGSVSALQFESARIEMDSSPSPFFSEFSAHRPQQAKRTPSLSAHVPGEKGPAEADVLSAALRSLVAMIRNCQVPQTTQVINSLASFLDTIRWNDIERSCWFADRLAALMSLQYRFVVPTRLVEILAQMPDEELNTKHTTLVAMITTILSSSTSLVGLGVVDLTNSLVSLISRRIRFDRQDGLLPALVTCLASLGTHIYYADQINDIVEEITIRMSELDQSDKSRSDILRVLIHAIMGIINAAIRADALEAKATAHPETPSAETHAHAGDTPPKESGSSAKAKGKAPQTAVDHLPTRTGRRNLVSPQVWQETLPLLCESTYSVRAAYARALLLYIKNELPRIPKSGESIESEAGSKHRHSRPEVTVVRRFCNALHAALYTLAMSSCLGSGSPVPSIDTAQPSPETQTGEVRDSPLPISDTNGPDASAPQVSPKSSSVLPSAAQSKLDNMKQVTSSESRGSDKGVSFNLQEPTPAATPVESSTPGRNTPRKSDRMSNGGESTPPRRRVTRRVSLPLNRLNSQLVIESFENVATPFDFTAIVQILEALHEAVPVAALESGTPMLLALDRDASVELVRRPGDGRQGAWVFERKRSIREVVGTIWRIIAKHWGATSLLEYADKMLNTLPEPFEVPNPSAASSDVILPPPEPAVQFVPNTSEGESSSSSLPFLDPDIIINALTTSPSVLSVIGASTGPSSSSQDTAGALLRQFTSKWTVESALKDSVERFSSAQLGPSDDTHFDVASALMSLNNNSYQSFNRPNSGMVTRPVDVTDLREALGGRVRTDSFTGSNGLNGSSPPSIISTATGTGTGTGARSLSVNETTPKKKGVGMGGGQSTDVQEVLKDIFKGTRRRGGAMKRGLQGVKPGHTDTTSPGAGAGTNGLANGENVEMKNLSGPGTGAGSGSAALNGGAKANGVVLGPEASTTQTQSQSQSQGVDGRKDGAREMEARAGAPTTPGVTA